MILEACAGQATLRFNKDSSGECESCAAVLPSCPECPPGASAPAGPAVPALCQRNINCCFSLHLEVLWLHSTLSSLCFKRTSATTTWLYVSDLSNWPSGFSIQSSVNVANWLLTHVRLMNVQLPLMEDFCCIAP